MITNGSKVCLHILLLNWEQLTGKTLNSALTHYQLEYRVLARCIQLLLLRYFSVLNIFSACEDHMKINQIIRMILILPSLKYAGSLSLRQNIKLQCAVSLMRNLHIQVICAVLAYFWLLNSQKALKIKPAVTQQSQTLDCKARVWLWSL